MNSFSVFIQNQMHRAINASKPRAKLSKAQVIMIFQAKTRISSASNIATVYGVSEKAVRDIWTGRTWSKETHHLDTSRQLRPKINGRPKGCRDKKPRKKKTISPVGPSRSSGSSAQGLPHNNTHRLAGHALKQDILQTPLILWANREFSDSAACPKELFFSGQTAARWTSATAIRHASVDDQLFEWDEFWSSTTCVDPFCSN
jgi:hypothetical protein